MSETLVAKPVDREQVRILALTIGVREAARKTGIPVGTVCAWSKRDHWFASTPQPPSVIKQNGGAITASTTPAKALKDMLDAGQNPKLLSLLEKREYLAKAVRTPLSKINEGSPLAQKVRRRTDKDGNASEEIESVAKLRALELDARLAGELDDNNRGTGNVMINVGLLCS